MSKEVIKPSQFGKVDPMRDELIDLSASQREELLELYGEKTSGFRPGQLVAGTVVAVDNNGVLVDVAYKSDGFIQRYEFSAHELKELKPGASIDVIIDDLENAEGAVVLSYEKAKAQKAWDRITALFEDGKPVEGIITHTVKGGLSVDIGIPAFLPGSQVDLQRVTDFSQFVGQTIVAEIIKLNKKRGNVIISRRKFLSEQRVEARRKAMDTIAEGQVIRGVVKNITNYGVFIDIGGVDGLLHITDMTWGRIAHPSELLKIGETVTVKVLSVDKDTSKISLGIKQLSDNPWSALEPSIEAGSIVKGKISSIADYGLFVEVAPGVEGLVHISEISWTNRVSDLRKHYSVGDTIEARVVSLDKDNRRMSLSVKQLSESPWKTISKQFEPGQRITGTVSNVTDFGVFIQLIPGVDGLAHISDLSWTRHISHPSELYRPGQDVEAVILSIDEANKRVSLGIKQLEQDPWQSMSAEYPVGAIVEGEVSKIVNGNTFIRMPNGIEGLLSTRGEQEEVKLTVGEKRQFRIADLNQADRKLWLSVNLEPTEQEQKEEMRARPSKETKPRAPKAPAAPRKKAAREDFESESKPATRSLFQIELEKYKGSSND